MVACVGRRAWSACSLIDFGPALHGRRGTRGESRLIATARPHRPPVDRPRCAAASCSTISRIENLDPTATPFFHARRIVVTMPWWTILLRREIFIESVVLSDWRMLIETYARRRAQLHQDPAAPALEGPRRFMTTVQLVRAERGEFTYQDYGAPWSTVAREARHHHREASRLPRRGAIRRAARCRSSSSSPCGRTCTARSHRRRQGRARPDRSRQRRRQVGRHRGRRPRRAGRSRPTR